MARRKPPSPSSPGPALYQRVAFYAVPGEQVLASWRRPPGPDEPRYVQEYRRRLLQPAEAYERREPLEVDGWVLAEALRDLGAIPRGAPGPASRWRVHADGGFEPIGSPEGGGKV